MAIELDRMGWTNNSQPAINDVSLKKMEENMQKAITELENLINGTVLYDNEAGSKETITLSQSSSEFKYIEIYYFSDDSTKQNSVKIYSPNGKTFSLDTIVASSATLYWYIIKATVNETKITFSNPQYVNISGNSINLAQDNNVFVTRVVGYK